MKIAFYAPLKAPDHPVPSGDRLMARAMLGCLRQAGHQVTVASDLRMLLRDPHDAAGFAALSSQAGAERRRIAAQWRGGAPDLWFCYHSYYKAVDLIGPALCAEFGLPRVMAEASYSARRNIGHWAEAQAEMRASLHTAAAVIWLTARDHAGLAAVAPGARYVRLRPFIDCSGFGAAPMPEPCHLITVAMMRPGDKLQSYARLAAALALLPADLPWTLSVVGDGPQRPAVEALFAGFAPGRLHWHGRQEPAAVAALLARASAYVWPGCGEAYGLAYLEAQAAGLPVVAFATGGVPEVVADGITGLLTPPGDDTAFAAAIARLLGDAALRARLAEAARRVVRRDHSTEVAAQRLDAIVTAAVAVR